MDDQFLRAMIAIKNKVYMLLWKYPAFSNGVPATPVSSTGKTNPLEGFVKHRVRLYDRPVRVCFYVWEKYYLTYSYILGIDINRCSSNDDIYRQESIW